MEEKQVRELIESFKLLEKACTDAITTLEKMSEEMKKESESPTIIYVCDRRKCKECDEFCTHTRDITHAENFKNVGDGIFIEQEPCTGSLEMKLDGEQFATLQNLLQKETKSEKPVESEWSYKEVDRKAKKGEYIKIVNKNFYEHYYENGDIFKVSDVTSIDDSGVYVDLGGDVGEWPVYHDEYVVLEGYKPLNLKKSKKKK